MPEPREILIYPGSGKTGTSALQRMLRCSVAGLKEAGWNYLHDPREGDDVASGAGNGPQLAVELVRSAGRDAWKEFNGNLFIKSEPRSPVAELDRLAPTGERSIVSAEPLQIPTPEDWFPVFEQLESEGSRVRIVYCVRDVYPFCWSGWIQNVKSKGFTTPFATQEGSHDAVNLFRGASTFNALSERFPSVLAPEDLVFLHYETIRSRLVTALLEAGGIPLEACDLRVGGSVQRPVNRSLNQAEIALMLQLNERADPFHAKWCGETLTLRQDAEPSRPVFSQPAFDRIAALNSSRVEEFNSALPPGTDWKVSILDRDLVGVDEEDPNALQSAEARRAIEFLLSFEPEEPLKSLLESLRPRELPIRRAARRLRTRARAALKPSS